MSGRTFGDYSCDEKVFVLRDKADNLTQQIQELEDDIKHRDMCHELLFWAIDKEADYGPAGRKIAKRIFRRYEKYLRDAFKKQNEEAEA
jgi:hypothetical protein